LGRSLSVLVGDKVEHFHRDLLVGEVTSMTHVTTEPGLERLLPRRATIDRVAFIPEMPASSTFFLYSCSVADLARWVRVAAFR
jgi:hypothetical protein